MSDLISRQAALRTDCFGDGHEGLRAFHSYQDYRKMREYLKSLPPAQPEIIRCKDCKYANEDVVCQNNKGLAIQDDDDFCSYAERKANER